MKIKCPCYPWCNEELETEKDLGNHLFSKHAHDIVCWTLAEKIFKIHELIEYLQKLNPSKETETDLVNLAKLEVLKSLLEK